MVILLLAAETGSSLGQNSALGNRTEPFGSFFVMCWESTQRGHAELFRENKPTPEHRRLSQANGGADPSCQ